MTLKKGDVVIIHNSKFDRTLFVEGKATLVKKNKVQPDPDRELWKVEFEDGEQYNRYVSEKDKV
jgi:hypothetical protein